nr:hypothetical protein [Shewanella sp.]
MSALGCVVSKGALKSMLSLVQAYLGSATVNKVEFDKN